MKIKAAVLYKIAQPLIVEDDIEIPTLQPGQVLVKILYSGICHSQLMEIEGKRGQDRYLPHLLGHEASGVVVETGRDVRKVKTGDQVVLTWIKGKGIDVPGAKYQKGNISINSGPVTTFSNYSVVSENRCVKLPKNIPLDIASLFGCAVLTGAGIVIHAIRPTQNNTIAIFGMGGIGLSALMATRLYHCRTVIAIDIDKDKLRLAEAIGATHIIDASLKNPIEQISKITKGCGVDFSIEATGSAVNIEKAFISVRNGGGLCIFASHPAFGEKISIDPFHLICGKQIRGSWGGESQPDADILYYARLYREGKLPLERLISHRYPLEKINEAFAAIKNHKVNRALIEICHY